MTRQWTGVAVVVPCHNEERAVATVVHDFHTALPGATVVVVDNASTDTTRQRASDAGAIVLHEPRAGKGYAVRRLFSDVEADAYVLVDGDATYDASAAPEMVALVLEHGVDMVNGARVGDAAQRAAERAGHSLGNRALSWIFRSLFRLALADTLSGYRVMSRRFVKSFPSRARGFEIETELNVHCAAVDASVVEVPTRYRLRPEGSVSKLSTYGDGYRILRRNLRLFRDARPLLAFSLLALPWFALAVVLVQAAVREYVRTGQVTRFPSLIAGVAAFVVAVQLVVSGMVLERVTRSRDEAVRLAYLAVPAAGTTARTRSTAPDQRAIEAPAPPPPEHAAHD
jgi:glycosyltransferase involved in cell wall biosynthesis